MRIRQLLGSGLIALAFVGMALPAAAMSVSSNPDSYASYSVEQLQTLIGQLQKRVEELKQGTKCFVSEQELSLGDGEDGQATADVRRLQMFLKEKGVFAGKDTGYFGKVTRSALMGFQKSVGVAPSGAFDADTRAKAHALFCKKVTVKSGGKEVKNETLEKQKPLTSGKVTAISLAVDGTRAYWKVSGYSGMGFKLVWSKQSGPTYPTRDGDRYQYLSEPTSDSASLEAFDGPGTYRVRVCEYLGGACGVYSNEVTVQL